jgi:hypothetical protein
MGRVEATAATMFLRQPEIQSGDLPVGIRVEHGFSLGSAPYRSPINNLFHQPNGELSPLVPGLRRVTAAASSLVSDNPRRGAP